MNLSKEEAIQFVTEVLEINPKKFGEDRILFLNELIKAVHCSVPFQNITLLCQPEAYRHVPTLKEINTAVMGGYGGLCYTIGVFMTHLLEALGYEVYLSAGSINSSSSNNHVISIVQNLTFPGSKHLVDAWSGWPTFEAIPLDFENESPIYNHSYLEFKFVREGHTILRIHWKGDKHLEASSCEYVVDGWIRVCELDLTPRNISFFDQSMTNVYTKPGVMSPFLVSFRAVVYRELKLVAIKDSTLLLENDNHELEVTKFQTHEEMSKTVSKYFPQFRVEDVTKAMDSLHLLE